MARPVLAESFFNASVVRYFVTDGSQVPGHPSRVLLAGDAR